MSEQPYEQLTDLESLVGRTIERAVYNEDIVTHTVVLVFRDGTFAEFVVTHGYDGDVDVNVGEGEMSIPEKQKLGLATDAEIAAHEAKEREKAGRREAELRTERRREYERLKAEFEDNP